MGLSTILFVWTVVAAGSSGRLYHDWRPIGEFSSHAACMKAAHELRYEPSNFRCVGKA